MNLALLIASLAAGVVQGIPQVSGTIKQILADVSSSLRAIIASGVTTSINPQTILIALSGVISALKEDPSLPADKLSLIAALESAAAAALAADQTAQTKVDPTTLSPIQPL